MAEQPVLNVDAGIADDVEGAFGPDPSPDIGYCSSPESNRAEVDVDTGAQPSTSRSQRTRDLQCCKVKVSPLAEANQDSRRHKTMKSASTMTATSFIHEKPSKNKLLRGKSLDSNQPLPPLAPLPRVDDVTQLLAYGDVLLRTQSLLDCRPRPVVPHSSYTTRSASQGRTKRTNNNQSLNLDVLEEIYWSEVKLSQV